MPKSDSFATETSERKTEKNPQIAQISRGWSTPEYRGNRKQYRKAEVSLFCGNSCGEFASRHLTQPRLNSFHGAGTLMKPWLT